MFRPYMAIISFFLRFRYINCDVEIFHPIIILECLCIGGYYITLMYKVCSVFGGERGGNCTPCI